MAHKQALLRMAADVARARRRWMREQGMYDPARLVFIDETSTSTNMVRLRGRCRRDGRAFLVRPRRFSRRPCCRQLYDRRTPELHNVQSLGRPCRQFDCGRHFDLPDRQGGAYFANMNDYSDFEPTYRPRRKDNGRWCVVLIRFDGSEREIGDFASDSDAWDWINTNAGKQISDL